MSEALSIYDVSGTLANIDANVPRLLILGACSLIANFVYFGSGIRNGFRLKTYTMPVVCTLLFIPHDLMYLLMYDKWFYQYDHWFMQLFFVGLIITNVMEFTFFYQVLRWGRKDILPQVSQGVFVAIMFTALAGIAVSWYSVKTVLADELWFFSFGWTVWFCVPFAIPLMLKRGSTLGQSNIMWTAYIVMAVCWWTAVWPLDPFFRSLPWVGLGVITVLWAIATMYFIAQFEKTTQASDNTAVAPA